MNNTKTSIRSIDPSGTIDKLIKILEKHKNSGSTHYELSISSDPMWPFKFIQTFMYETSEEQKLKRIAELEKEIAKLKGKE